MDLHQIKQILELVREHELSELEIEHDGLRVKVRKDRNGAPVVVSHAPAAPAVHATPAMAAPAGPTAAAPTAPAAATEGPLKRSRARGGEVADRRHVLPVVGAGLGVVSSRSARW